MDTFKKRKLSFRYAEGLRALVTSEEVLVKLAESYQLLNTILRDVPEVVRLLKNPVIPFKTKKEIIDYILNLIDAPEFIRYYAWFLVKNHRIEILNEIAKVFSENIDSWLNRVEVEVITAIPIPENAEKKLVKTLEKFTEKQVRLIKNIDSRILGGLIVKFYGFTFDFSYRTQMEKLKEYIVRKGLSQDVIKY
ncbi:MAG: ATP synthase F1 subunit delta [Candidatus Hydrogenedentes bacterium]|nr:ATP synthase F1 subunit delta [Candidatus Hydrogenedentota bacterium]